MEQQDERWSGRRDRSVRGRRSSPRWRLLGALMAVTLLLGVALVPSDGQAMSSKQLETAERRAAEKAERESQRERALDERRAAAEERRAGRKNPKRKSPEGGERKFLGFSDQRANGVIAFGCDAVTYTFRGFPALAGDAATEKLTVDGRIVAIQKAEFTGPEGSNTISFVGPPGRYTIDAGAKWKVWEPPSTEGGAPQLFHGAFDIHTKEECPATPSFTIEKLQRIAGSAGGFTSSTLSGAVGETVEYEIVVANTGNVGLTLGGLTDPRCDAGTIGGGPGSALAPGESTTYTCTHLLTDVDAAVGSLANSATDTATPPEGDGGAITHTSNTVVVEIPATGSGGTPPPTQPQTPPPGNSDVLSDTSSSNSSSTGNTLGSRLPQSGTLAFSGSTAPSLRGPQGCVRGRFDASVKAAGVSSVTFGLDGHKLKTLTARNARKSLLTVTVDGSKLKVGAHHLTAKIMMVQVASAAKVHPVTRSLTFVRCHSVLVTPRFTG